VTQFLAQKAFSVRHSWSKYLFLLLKQRVYNSIGCSTPT